MIYTSESRANLKKVAISQDDRMLAGSVCTFPSFAKSREGWGPRLSFCILLLAFYTVLGRAHAEQGDAPLKATLCELAEQPGRYAGKMVAVHATEMGKDFWIEDFTNKPCSSWTQVIVVYPDRVKPAPGFDLLRDEAFNKFFEEIRKGRNVEATYEGRFDVAYVWRNHKRIDVGSDKGFGKKDRYGARIVLRRISDVVSRPRYSK